MTATPTARPASRRYRSLAWTPHKEAVLCAAIGLGYLVQERDPGAELAHMSPSAVEIAVQ